MSEGKLVPAGLGMGGLGGFTTESLIASVKEAQVEAGTATGDDIRDAMGNVRPKLEQVDVKHQGVCLFQFADGKKVDALVGVIVAHTFHNSWFETAFEDHQKGERPPCASNDAVSVNGDAEKPQASACGSCHRNRDARDQVAKDAAFKLDRKEICSNYLSLAIALPGREVPVRLRLSNTSFKPWAEYAQAIGTRGRFLPHEVATKLTLENRKQGNAEYSVVRFELVGPLSKELAASFAAQKDNYRALLRRTAVDAGREESTAGPSGEAAAALARARAAATNQDAGL